MEIIGGDSFVQLTAQPGTDVVVVGYRGEPYLWFRPDGTVAENRNAPTTYQNLSRYGTDAPADADPDAAPDWHQVASDHRWAWHDHRTHWMQTTRPLGASPGDQILEAVVPLVVNDADVAVTVASTWQPAPSPLPAWLGALAGASAAVGWWATRRRGRARDAVSRSDGGAGARRRHVAVPVAAVGDGTAPRVVGAPRRCRVVRRRRRRRGAASVRARPAPGGLVRRRAPCRFRVGGFWADAAMLLVGVELAIWAWVKRDGLSAALIPTGAPGWLDRFAVAAAFTSGVGFTALALWALFGPRQRVQGGLGTGRVGAAREHLVTVVGDEQRVLELRRALAVGGDGGPVVVPDLVVHRAERDHRLDRERHPRAHDDVRPRVVVVQHLDVTVELLADGVTDERPHDAVAVLLGVFLDRPADVADRPARA